MGVISMRLIAIILNFVLIGTVIYLVSSNGDDQSLDEIAMAVLFISAPISSLTAFYFNNSEGWMSLYFRRKAMEEKAKIKHLIDNDA